MIAHLLITAVEFGGTHSTRNAQIAAHSITQGRYSVQFWGGSVALSVLAGILALVSVTGGDPLWVLIAAVLVQPALLLHERVFVMAAQEPPLS